MSSTLFPPVDIETALVIYVTSVVVVSGMWFIASVGKNIVYASAMVAIGVALPHYLSIYTSGVSPMAPVLNRCIRLATSGIARTVFHYDDFLRTASSFSVDGASRSTD